MTYNVPGVYVEERSSGSRPIVPVGTSTAGFIGVAPGNAPLNTVQLVTNWTEFYNLFCTNMPRPDADHSEWYLAYAVHGFFLNGGTRCFVINVGSDGSVTGDGKPGTGISLFEGYDEIAIVAAPGFTDSGSYDALLAHCEKMKDRVAVIDSPLDVKSTTQLVKPAVKAGPGEPVPPLPDLRARSSDKGFGAFYHPWIYIRDPFSPKNTIPVPPSGHIAGVYARTDATRGVHKAPANESIRGATGLLSRVSPAEQGPLNDAGVNVIRSFPREGILIWGARTLASDSDWKYVNVRRLFSMIEKSIAMSTHWIVFEPNDNSLWKAIRRDVTAFLTLLWQQGALMGMAPEDAFFVKCDAETNPASVRDLGMVVTVIGIAPVKPAEFVIFQISQSESGAKA